MVTGENSPMPHKTKHRPPTTPPAPPLPEGKATIIFDLPVSLHVAVKRKADGEGLKVAEAIRRVLRQWIETPPPNTGTAKRSRRIKM